MSNLFQRKPDGWYVAQFVKRLKAFPEEPREKTISEFKALFWEVIGDAEKLYDSALKQVNGKVEE